MSSQNTSGTPRNLRPYYSLKILSGNLDLSMNLMKVRIGGSVIMPYQSISLEFILNSANMVLDKLFGQNDLTLTITEMTEDRTPRDVKEIKLFMIHSNIPLHTAPKDPNQQHPANVPITLLCLPKNPFIGMTTPVNKVYDETRSLTPVQVVQDIFNTFCKGLTSDIRTTNQNKYIIPQLIIKGMNFVDCVRYLDGSDARTTEKFGQGFGLYNGPMFFSSSFDGNKFSMWDLKSRMNDSPEYIVYHFAEGLNDDKIMEIVGSDNTHFYTYGNLDNVHKLNRNLMKSGYNYKFMSKPMDSFFNWMDVSAASVYQENTPTYKNSTMNYLHDAVKSRTVFLPPTTGTDNSDSFLRSKISKDFLDASEIRFTIPKQFALDKLLMVGVPIEIRPQLLEYAEYMGKYIVKSCDIELIREGDSWLAGVGVIATRGNVII